MVTAIHRLMFRQWLALVLVVSLAFAPAFVSVGHAGTLSAEAARHAILKADKVDHGHSHDDGVGDERRPGHIHGQQTGDHSHDFGRFISFRLTERDFLPTGFDFDLSEHYTPPDRQRLDRPPRQI